MKDASSLHQQVQEHCDCFATTDPLKGMAAIEKDENRSEAAVKWLALAALHGINSNAEKITLKRSNDGSTRVVAHYRPAELPSPGSDVGSEILNAIREITHIEAKKGKTPLALGFRGNSMDLNVKIKSKKGKEQVTIKFPK